MLSQSQQGTANYGKTQSFSPSQLQDPSLTQLTVLKGHRFRIKKQPANHNYIHLLQDKDLLRVGWHVLYEQRRTQPLLGVLENVYGIMAVQKKAPSCKRERSLTVEQSGIILDLICIYSWLRLFLIFPGLHYIQHKYSTCHRSDLGSDGQDPEEVPRGFHPYGSSSSRRPSAETESLHNFGEEARLC